MKEKVEERWWKRRANERESGREKVEEGGRGGRMKKKVEDSE